MAFRKIEIKVCTKVGIDKETFDILNPQKKLQKKSMMRIVKNLITEKHGKKE